LVRVTRLSLRERAKQLKRQTLVVYFAARDKRTPWPARILALGVAAYALRPIDLIPDFIPVLGLLDDLIIVPLGIALAIRMIPAHVMADVEKRAAAATEKPTSVPMAVFFVLIWIAVLSAASWWLYRILHT
jgi:uncharacterized membrane protein YkvA (DUF1232 family)